MRSGVFQDFISAFCRKQKSYMEQMESHIFLWKLKNDSEYKFQNYTDISQYYRAPAIKWQSNALLYIQLYWYDYSIVINLHVYSFILHKNLIIDLNSKIQLIRSYYANMRSIVIVYTYFGLSSIEQPITIHGVSWVRVLPQSRLG